MRRTYWTCTKFADWLRGTDKPHAETSKGWRDWKRMAKAAHPFRYWLADEGLDYIQNFVMWPIDKLYAIKYYINNRFITRTHALTAHPRDIKPGEWQDVGNRFLPCLFNELVDFVEVELAWWHLAWEGKEERKKYNAPWWRFGWWNMRLWRCPQAGLDNLEWQRNLKNDDTWMEKDDPRFGQPTYQAVAAQEILDLYTWWTVTRPARPDPYEASGWSAICAKRRKERDDDIFLSDDNEEERKESSKALDILHDLEAKYEAEDEEMMIRLIKVRKSLWT
jgi:hypothetical protein